MQSSLATLKKINLVKSKHEEEVRREQGLAARVTPYQENNRLQIFVHWSLIKFDCSQARPRWKQLGATHDTELKSLCLSFFSPKNADVSLDVRVKYRRRCDLTSARKPAEGPSRRHYWGSLKWLYIPLDNKESWSMPWCISCLLVSIMQRGPEADGARRAIESRPVSSEWDDNKGEVGGPFSRLFTANTRLSERWWTMSRKSEVTHGGRRVACQSRVKAKMKRVQVQSGFAAVRIWKEMYTPFYALFCFFVPIMHITRWDL